MKKTLLTLCLGVFVLVASAQDEYLPEKGDVAIGIQADPFINFIGNMFNGTAGNTLNLNSNTLYFRYYLSTDAALRLAVSIDASSTSLKYYVQDDEAVAADPLSTDEVQDMQTNTDRAYHVRLGYQKFSDYKRMRISYGIDLGYQFSRTKELYEYGNKMTATNTNPTTNWGALGTRNLEIVDGAVHNIGASAFAGAEYYLFPKVCIGGELGLSYYYGFTGEAHTTTETIVAGANEQNETITNAGSKQSSFETNFPYYFGNLYIMFHF